MHRRAFLLTLCGGLAAASALVAGSSPAEAAPDNHAAVPPDVNPPSEADLDRVDAEYASSARRRYYMQRRRYYMARRQHYYNRRRYYMARRQHYYARRRHYMARSRYYY